MSIACSKWKRVFLMPFLSSFRNIRSSKRKNCFHTRSSAGGSKKFPMSLSGGGQGGNHSLSNNMIKTESRVNGYGSNVPVGDEDSWQQFCCLVENGRPCSRIAGNASYSKRIQKTVAQRKLKLHMDNSVSCRYFFFVHCKDKLTLYPFRPATFTFAIITKTSSKVSDRKENGRIPRMIPVKQIRNIRMLTFTSFKLTHCAVTRSITRSTCGRDSTRLN